VGLPRKNGKSTLGAALAIYALVCLGPAAHVYSCAGDKKQASIVFDEAKRMVRADPELAGIIRIQRWHLEGPEDSIYRVLSADAELQQGLNPSFVVFDEVHVQPNGDLWDAMRFGMGARPNPMMVGITTAGFDRTSLAWDLYEQGKRGDIYFWWSEPKNPNCDWMDHVAWAEANPALGDFLFESSLYEDADGDAKHESGFRRFHLNQWTTTSSAWLPHGAWAGIEKAHTFDPSEPFAAFLDGSWSNDSTGMVACTLAEPHLSVIDHWKPDPELGHIDMVKVEKKVREVLAMRGCRAVSFDPSFLTDLFSRLEVEYPGRIFEWPTNSLARMVPACQDFYTSVIEHTVTQDADPRLAEHIGNAVLKEDRYGPRIVKEAKGSQRKIDLAVCAVGALSEARRLGVVTIPTPRFIPIGSVDKPGPRTFEEEQAELERFFGEDE
jgi:phage terminase large subunit-like protein